MPRLSFSLRDVFWLTLVVAVILGMGRAWWVDRGRVRSERESQLNFYRHGYTELMFEKMAAEAKERANAVGQP